MLYKKRCDVCERLFETNYITQKTCSEPCRVIVEASYKKKVSINTYKQERLEAHLNNIKLHEPMIYEWKNKHRPQVLSGGDYSIFGNPIDNIKARSKK